MLRDRRRLTLLPFQNFSQFDSRNSQKSWICCCSRFPLEEQNLISFFQEVEQEDDRLGKLPDKVLVSVLKRAPRPTRRRQEQRSLEAVEAHSQRAS